MGGDLQRVADAGVSSATSSLPHLNRISQAFGPGHDMGGVRAQVGGAGAAASQAMGAKAYATRGDRIAFAQSPGLRVAAHEAAHLVQQKGGISLPGGVGRVGDAHERHADAVADRVVRGQSASDLLQRYAAPQPKTAAVQGLSGPQAPEGKAEAPMLQMWKPLSKVPWMAYGKWDALMKGGRAAYMEARDLKLAPGQAVGAGKNAPTVAPLSWMRLKGWKLTHTKGPPGYVRMHMLSDRMGGAGNTISNLAPGTNGMNQRHFNRVEKPLIAALDAGGEVNSYKVDARYQIGNGGLKTAKGKAAWANTLDHVVCRAQYRPKAGAAKIKLLRIITETPQISKKKNWKGH